MHTIQTRIFRKCLAAMGALAFLLAPALLAQDAPAVDAASMLNSLHDIRDTQQKTSRDVRGRVLQQLAAAAASPSAAKAFYEDAVQQTRFTGQTREHAQFRDWKKRQDEGGTRQETPEVPEAIQQHLVYLGLTLQHSFGARPADLAGPLMRYTATINSLDDKVLDTPMMKTPVTGSIFVRWLALESLIGKGGGDWEMVPRATDSIWEKSVLPVLRGRKDQLAVDYWTNRIAREEAGVAGTERAFDAARFASFRRPELLWTRAQEMLAIGQRNRAMREMFAIIKASPGHPSAAEWTAKLEELLKPPPTASGTGS
jgi:hypothetical protein